jgi:type IV secretory pathway VirB9-like protein
MAAEPIPNPIFKISRSTRRDAEPGHLLKHSSKPSCSCSPAYSPIKRQEIVGIIGDPVTITFPQGEAVIRVSQTGLPGEKVAWLHQPTPKSCETQPDAAPCSIGNNLTLWPSIPGTTSMTVITVTANNQQKPYAFRLIAKKPPDNPDDPDPSATLNLIFKGGEAHAPPKEPPVEQVRRVREKQLEVAENTLAENSWLGTDQAPCHYLLKGDPHSPIAPLCPISNGQWIAMRFPGLSQKPAVYVLTGSHDCGADNGKDERLARQHASGDFIVVEEHAPRFCLRLGDNVLQLTDTAFNPAGNPTGGGTIAPATEVQRDIIQAKSP